MTSYDAGPPASFEALFDRVPKPSVPADFWIDWGPVFYRGRLDGSARMLCIASDPGATERIAGSTLVGDAGQRVQGFLAKLGLTRSYLCLNAFAFALHPSKASAAPQLLAEPAQLNWRNELYDLAASSAPQLQAVIAFGVNAKDAVKLWPGRPSQLPPVEIPHPTSHDEQALLTAWRQAITNHRQIVTPDHTARPAAPTTQAASPRATTHRSRAAICPSVCPTFSATTAGRAAQARRCAPPSTGPAQTISTP